MRPVAITGRAWRTPLGATVDDAMSRLLAGERAVAANPRFDASAYACMLAAPVLSEPAKSRHARFLRRMGLFAVETALEALRESGAASGDRLGLFSGFGGLRANWPDLMPPLQGQDEALTDTWRRGFKLFDPFWMLRHLSNNAHALLAADARAKGEGITLGGSNAGAQALAAAIAAIEAGAVDAAIVVAHDSLLEPETLVELGVRNAATRARDARDVAPPYSARAAGFVPGEAAAAIVVESAGAARSRGARIHAFVSAADAADGASREASAATIAAAASTIAQGDEEAVDGASIAQPESDLAERAAIAHLVSPRARLTSIASAMGALGAAGSIVQAIALAEMLRRGAFAPIAGLGDADRGPLSPVAGAPARIAATSALALCAGSPGLAGAVRVVVEPTPI